MLKKINLHYVAVLLAVVGVFLGGFEFKDAAAVCFWSVLIGYFCSGVYLIIKGGLAVRREQLKREAGWRAELDRQEVEIKAKVYRDMEAEKNSIMHKAVICGYTFEKSCCVRWASEAVTDVYFQYKKQNKNFYCDPMSLEMIKALALWVSRVYEVEKREMEIRELLLKRSYETMYNIEAYGVEVSDDIKSKCDKLHEYRRFSDPERLKI